VYISTLTASCVGGNPGFDCECCDDPSQSPIEKVLTRRVSAKRAIAAARLSGCLLKAMFLMFQAFVHAPLLLAVPTNHFSCAMNGTNLEYSRACHQRTGQGGDFA